MGKVLTLNIKLVVSVDCMQMATEWEKSQSNSIEIYIYCVWSDERKELGAENHKPIELLQIVIADG